MGITGALLSLLGDTGAQLHEQKFGSGRRFSYDPRRALTNFADGAIVSGPLTHFGYELLERTLPTDATRFSNAKYWAASHSAAAHVLVDDFVFDAFCLAIMMTTTGLGEGLGLKQL